jgi:hypothetical protein
MSTEQIIWIDARDKPGLLIAIMREFTNQSHISFEGSLRDLAFYGWPNAAYTETAVLRRQTISPKLDFVVVPLTELSVEEIWRELSKKDHLVHQGIVHVQIEHNGRLAFGGYDNFHRDCTVAYSSVLLGLLENLKARGVVRDYGQADA